MKRVVKTSWNPVAPWYKSITKNKGHFFHSHVVIPNMLRMLELTVADSVLDLACGTGVMGRSIPKNVAYTGVDIAPDLIESAKTQDKSTLHTYLEGDVGRPIGPIIGKNKFFTKVTCILALQNIEKYNVVFQNMAEFLAPRGTGIIVLNHPCFRIPRQSSWGVDTENKLQYRRINRYLSPLEIPITMHPGQKSRSPVTWSYHQPLSVYINGLSEVGLVTTRIEEWASTKESEGTHKKMEDRSRNEIPLFMAIKFQKI